MKGVIIAGGNGTRLRPLTLVTNKQLLPIYDKPMILYPIETLVSLGVTDMLLISNGESIGTFMQFLGDGSEYGVTLTYKVQKVAGGIAQALGLARDFAHGEQVAVILGDNIFDNEGLVQTAFASDLAYIYVKEVENASRFGVLLDGAIVEKPAGVGLGKAVTGLYVYPRDVFDIIDTLVPSARGELEITDVNNVYLQQKRCVTRDANLFWADAGTPDSLLAIGNHIYEKRKTK